jgi:hypothetical protein
MTLADNQRGKQAETAKNSARDKTPETIFCGIERFARERGERMARREGSWKGWANQR